jgi:molybdopterin molybdotransferase
MPLNDIGFDEAIQLTMQYAETIGTEIVSILKAAGKVAAQDIFAVIDSPSVDASLKDGYAVISRDVANASIENPAKLSIIDTVAAGGHSGQHLTPGETIRILTGAPVPKGAQAVLMEEFTSRVGDIIYAHADASPGRNILKKGAGVGKGQGLVKAGDVLTPQRIGLMIAGGVSDVKVYKRPRIGLLATGNEAIMPGQAMSPGKVYASNVGLQHAWLTMLGFDVRILSAIDSVEQISEAIRDLSKICDVIITSGGAWKGDRDLVATVVNFLGGKMVFHHVRLGPGKASGMGLIKTKKIFCLSGGPSSNMSGFVMIVLLALFKMSGTDRCPYWSFKGTLEKNITGQANWTNLVQCDIIKTGSDDKNKPDILLRPRKLKNRLNAMATNHAIVVIPEGVEKFEAGDTVSFICLDCDLFAYPFPFLQ